MAGGVPAGRLSIELVAEIARLQQDLDKAKRAVSAASKDISASARAANDNIARMGPTTKLAGHHIQNLSSQLQDVFIGLQGGQKPMTVFLQQGSQIAGIMTQAGIGVGGLARELGGMITGFVAAHPLLLAAAGAAAVFAAGLGLVTAEINKTSDVTVTWQDVMLGAFDVVKASLESEVTAAFQSMGLDVKAVWDFIVKATKSAINFIIGANLVVPKVISAVYSKIGPAIADGFYSAANLAIRALNWMVQASAEPLNLLIRAINAVFGKNIPEVIIGGIKEINNPVAGAMAALGQAGAQAFTQSFGTDYVGGMAESLSGAAQNRARLRDAAEKSGKDVGRTAGRAAGKAAGKEMADTWAAELAKQFDDAFKAEDDLTKRLESVWADNSKIDEQIAALKREQAVIGKTGAEREKLLTLMEQEAEIRPILGRIAELENDIRETGNDALKREVDALREQIALIKERNGIKISNAVDTEQIAKQAEALERTNAELRDMIGLLQSIGGLGSVLGGALGFLTGNDDAIGGSLGFLLKMKSGRTKADAEGKIIAKTIGDELRDVFGDFGESLKESLKGAATGMLAANLALGKQGTGGQIGSAIGGAAGKALGTAIAGPLGGAIGSVLGGIAGGFFGGMFKKTKWGRADISGVSSDPNMRGNSNSMKSSAGDAATSIIDSLKQIADELGGVAGEFSKISIGVRDGKWRVNTTGTSLKTSKGAIDFGKDGAEEAIAYAISEAIKAGAITGLRESTLTLLKAGDDFNAQLQKAMTFENVFKELQAELDPLGYELDQISKKFASLRTIFVEANATAEEMAQLDQLQALQEAKAREAAAAEAAAKKAASLEKEAELLALQGKATQALAKSREAELLQMDKALVAIQKQINAEQDAATRRGLQIQLLEAQGKLMAAQELSRAEVLRVTLDENKAIQQKIWLTEDLFTAYNRESEALQNTADKMRGFSTTLREFRDSIYASDGSTSSYTQALAKLIQTGSLASTGDETALGNLPGVGKDFLDVAKNSAKSMLDFQRAQALVANYADQAIGYTDNAATVAEQQLAEMKTTVGALVTLNDSVISVEQAIERLAQHNQANTTPAPAPTTGTGHTNQGNSNRDLKDGIDGMRRAFEQMLRKWNQMAPDGPMQVEVMP